MQPFSETLDYGLPLSCRSLHGNVFPIASLRNVGGSFVQRVSPSSLRYPLVSWSVLIFVYAEYLCIV